MFKKTISAVLLSLLVMTTLAVAVRIQSVYADDGDWWPMFHHDLTHTGYSTSTAPSTNQTLWNYTTKAPVDSSPAIVGGLVYVGAMDGNLYALNAFTGDLVWNYKTSGAVYSSPAVADGEVFVGSIHEVRVSNTLIVDAGMVYALNATNGALLWNQETYSTIGSSLAVAGGLVFVGSGNHVFALNESTGAFVWDFAAGFFVESSPAFAGGLVFVGSEDKQVYALNATNGLLVWDYMTGGYVDSSPAVVDGVVFVSSEDNMTYALNAANGAVLWNYTTGEEEWPSSPAAADGSVFVGSSNQVYALNATNGLLVWDYTTGTLMSSSPSVAGDMVFVGSDDGNLYALNESTGSLIWSYTTGGGTFSSPAVVEGIVYIASENGLLHAFGSIHDVGATNIVPYRTAIGEGYSLNVNVTAANQGSYIETFNVTVYVNNTSLETETVNNLPSSSYTTLTFTWNTTGFEFGNYTMSAYAWPVANETDTANNNFTGGIVTVTVPGDIDGDFKVSLADLVLLANAYGSHPNDVKWNPNADIDGNGIVGLSDLVIMALHYGQHYP